MPTIMKYHEDEFRRLDQLLKAYLRTEEFKNRCDQAYMKYRQKQKKNGSLR